MRLIIVICSLFISCAAMGQEVEEWTELRDGIEYRILSKKSIKNKDLALLKLKVRNSSDKTKVIKFTLFEYEGMLVKAKSQEEEFCLKPGFVDVIKIQLLDGSNPEDSTETSMEFTDLSITEVESCPN